MTYVNEELAEKFASHTSNKRRTKKKTVGHLETKSEKEQKRKQGRSKKILFFGILLLAFSFIGLPPVNDLLAVSFYFGSDKIKSLGEASGMSTHGKAVFYSTSPQLVDYPTLTEHCPLDSQDKLEYGCFLPDENKIYILNIQDERLAPLMAVTAAHEMLHKAYFALDANSKTELNKNIDEFRNSLTSSTNELKVFDDAIKPYTDSGMSQEGLYDEMHSIIGTELDHTQGDSVYDHYSDYFIDQHAPVAEKNIKDQNIANIDAEIKNEKASLDQFKANYIDIGLARQREIRNALQYDAYIGDVYTYNENVRRYNSNIPIIQSNIDKYNSRVEAYNAKVRDFNALFEDLKAAQPAENATPL